MAAPVIVENYDFVVKPLSDNQEGSLSTGAQMLMNESAIGRSKKTEGKMFSALRNEHFDFQIKTPSANVSPRNQKTQESSDFFQNKTT